MNKLYYLEKHAFQPRSGGIPIAWRHQPQDPETIPVHVLSPQPRIGDMTSCTYGTELRMGGRNLHDQVRDMPPLRGWEQRNRKNVVPAD